MIALDTIALIGAPGAGKSSTGADLAHLLNMRFVDVDDAIEAADGRTIPEIFSTEGEQFFRALELRETIEALGGGGVIALGGGAVVTPGVREALAGHVVVWLRTTVNQAAHRVGSGAKRPLLAGDPAGRIAKLITARSPLYAECATHTVDTDGLRPMAVARIIAETLEADLQAPGERA